MLDKLLPAARWGAMISPQPSVPESLPSKVVAITRILDEADIVEAFVRHTAFYADHHIFVDNGSRDGTLEILERLRAEGFSILVYQTLSVSLNEIYLGTFMYQKAVALFQADWVLCLDADEFIDDRAMPEGLRAFLKRLGENEPDTFSLSVRMIEYRRSRDDHMAELLVPRRICRRSEVTDNIKVIVSGRCAKQNVQISGGNHFAMVAGERIAGRSEPGLLLAHYAERSPYQSAAKWVKGWSKVLAAGPEVIRSDANSHYREPFRFLCDSPQVLFQSIEFMEAPANADLTVDPILYRGGPLRFTAETHDAMRATRMIMGYLEELATRYGRLLSECSDARRIIAAWDSELTGIIGVDASSDSEGPQQAKAAAVDQTVVRPKKLVASIRKIMSRALH